MGEIIMEQKSVSWVAFVLYILIRIRAPCRGCTFGSHRIFYGVVPLSMYTILVEEKMTAFLLFFLSLDFLQIRRLSYTFQLGCSCSVLSIGKMWTLIGTLLFILPSSMYYGKCCLFLGSGN